MGSGFGQVIAFPWHENGGHASVRCRPTWAPCDKKDDSGGELGLFAPDRLSYVHTLSLERTTVPWRWHRDPGAT